jgi:hypothetical protein
MAGHATYEPRTSTKNISRVKQEPRRRKQSIFNRPEHIVVLGNAMRGPEESQFARRGNSPVELLRRSLSDRFRMTNF